MKRASSWDALKWFSRREFTAPEKMDQRLLMMLDQARDWAGVPFVITSSFREGDEGSHGKGYAVDIAVEHSWDRILILKAVLGVGFRRVGVYRMHVHVDVDPGRAQDVLWYGRYHSETLEGVTWTGGGEDETQEDE